MPSAATSKLAITHRSCSMVPSSPTRDVKSSPTALNRNSIHCRHSRSTSVVIAPRMRRTSAVQSRSAPMATATASSINPGTVFDAAISVRRLAPEPVHSRWSPFPNRHPHCSSPLECCFSSNGADSASLRNQGCGFESCRARLPVTTYNDIRRYHRRGRCHSERGGAKNPRCD